MIFRITPEVTRLIRTNKSSATTGSLIIDITIIYNNHIKYASIHSLRMIIPVSNVNFQFALKSVFSKISEYNAFESDVFSRSMN